MQRTKAQRLKLTQLYAESPRGTVERNDNRVRVERSNACLTCEVDFITVYELADHLKEYHWASGGEFQTRGDQ